VLKVSRSAYYGWLNHKPTEREVEKARLIRVIRDIFFKSKRAYGRVYLKLKQMGYKVSKNQVAAIMRKEGLKSVVRKKHVVTTDSKHNYPVAPNLLYQNFMVSGPGQVWGSDISAPSNKLLLYGSLYAVFESTVEILSHYTKEVWWKGVVKHHSVLRMRRNKQSDLKCTGGRPFTVGRATAESMMRQRSMRRKPLYLACHPSIKKWLWRNVVSSYGLFIAMRGILISVVGVPHSHYPEPPGVEHVI